MESKKSFGKQLESIIEGRGFYIVMALCAAIIGVSIWSLLRTPVQTADEAEFDEVLSETEMEPYYPTAPEITDSPDEKTLEVPDSKAHTATQETVAEAQAVWPLEGSIQREYTMDKLEYDMTMADWRTHDGIDISADVGSKVAAIRNGTVLDIRTDDLYGTCVVVDHGNGVICSYANLEKIPTVYVGDELKAGDVIGSVGETAVCEAAQNSHLHLSATRNGQSISPLEILPQKS